MFDWTLNFGHLLTIVVLGAGGLGFVYTIRGRVDGLSDRMMALESETKKLIDVLVEQGRHDERINAMDVRMTAQGRRLDETIERLNRLIDSRE